MLMDLLRDDIATLTQLFGPSGHEDTVIAEFLAHIRKLGFNTTADRLGNVVVRARSASSSARSGTDGSGSTGSAGCTTRSWRDSCWSSGPLAGRSCRVM